MKHAQNEITGITEGGTAEKNGLIMVGDKLCSINGIEIKDKTSESELNKWTDDMLQNCGAAVTLELLRTKKGIFLLTQNCTTYQFFLTYLTQKLFMNWVL